MSSSKMKWISRVFTTLLVLSLLASGYGLYRLDSERKELYTEIASLNNRNNLMQKKYNEQKAMTEAMLRGKQAAESRARDAEFKISEIEKEKKKLESIISANKTKLAETIKSQEKEIAAHKDRFAKLRASYDNLRDESNRIIKEKNQAITLLTGERDQLDSSLKQETFQHKRCREHNGRLAELTDELVDKYQNKGVLGGTVEPFTQLKKVELEKICQEYRDRIDKETL